MGSVRDRVRPARARLSECGGRSALSRCAPKLKT